MTPDQERRLYGLFCAARDLEAAERVQYVKRECAGDEELCSRVLDMLAHADETGGALSEGPWRRRTTRIFHAGDTISERYRIVRFLDMGGMGEVYAAEDLLLNAPVAIKTIRPEFATDRQMLARFKREVQLEREIAHENVCPLFDISRHTTPAGDEVHYLTMKLLEGETLAARIGRGAIDPAEAVNVARQVAAGLNAAHRAGILHRDLKSSNIMLTRDREGATTAVVTDFGLARRIDARDRESTITRTGEALGTLDYLAPEVLEGGPATPAADVYALGVVFYEMLAGARPYRADPPQVAAFRRAKQAPPVDEDLPEADRRWRRLIAQCLAPEPALRPRLNAVIAALDGGSLPPATRFALPRPGKSWVIAGALAAILSLFAAAARYYGQRTRVEPGSVVYVMPLNNATGDPQFDSAGDLLSRQLRQSARFRLADEARVARARELMGPAAKANGGAAAREVALRAGAALVVAATLVQGLDGYVLGVDMERVGRSPFLPNRPAHREWRASGKQQMFFALKEAADWVRAAAGETDIELAQQNIAPDEAASSSWEALRLYRDSEAHVSQGKRETALGMLQRAIEIDPDFALAHMRMADLLNQLRRTVEANEHYRRALEAAGKRRLTKWEELRLRGIYALDIGEYRTAEAAFTELRALYPHEYIAPHYLASIYTQQGNLVAAMEMEREAAAKAPDSRIPVAAMLTLSLLSGKPDEAERAVQRLRDMGETAIAGEHAGVVRFLRGDVAGARAEWERLKQNSSPIRRSRAASLLAALMTESGRYRDAAAELNAGIAHDLAAGLEDHAALKQLALASLELRRGNTAESRNYCLDAIRRVGNVEQHRRAGVILARGGFSADALRVAAEVGPGWPGPLAEAARRQIRGEVLLAAHDTHAALAEFEAADRIDSRLRPRDYLAFAYAQAGDRDRAAFVYDGALRQRAWFWRYADCELPGLRASLLLQYAEVLAASGHAGEARAALKEYLELRPNADPDLPETATAKNLVDGIPAGQGNPRSKR